MCAAARKHHAILADVDKENHPTSGGRLALPSEGAAHRRAAAPLKVRCDAARSDHERTARRGAQGAAAQQHAVKVRRQQHILQLLRIPSAMLGQGRGQGATRRPIVVASAHLQIAVPMMPYLFHQRQSVA